MPARHAILGVLMQESLHGYDIDAEFKKGLRRICHITISQIYAYLKSMEEYGWVESELVLQKSNPPKKVFHVTVGGRQEMERWLRTPLETERQLRDELFTKIHFCSLLDPDFLPDLVEQQSALHKERLAVLQKELKHSDEFVRTMILEASHRHTQADYEWLQWVQQRFLAASAGTLPDNKTA
ncbi:MAG: PadR family transcriptional regulator [Ardenticatenales bacterium]|nr:PadR family transcriptional regulator [Ardenticatenales bacterium]